MPSNFPNATEDIIGLIMPMYGWLWVLIIVLFFITKVILPTYEDWQEEKKRKQEAISKKQQSLQISEIERKAKERDIASGIVRRSDYSDWLREQILKIEICLANTDLANRSDLEAMRSRLVKLNMVNSDDIIKMSGDISSVVDSTYNLQLIDQEWKRLETELAAIESKMR
ncbi:hypothetical protein KGP17_27610 (plasmid) [Serratia sp. JSRIV001]|uniref:hypothetical protein n=1 Tax=unclassified Serratia (in: enterobacteria) TaxID=2647522 RepID=UPI001CC0F7C7|nr:MULTISPECIES: hypothetical protein [unclassified Serratia (in: enterobacteria)]UAN48785.1 hypothetical protein KGP17_27610 [Serratia sp. JSRIV001]UAN54464.1 hypothetical protein KGP26_28775 [Serratia sp. JSRIV002]UAN60577.1 hypothetical protein KGP21_28990 [Serratia sp. JSRIV004]